MGLQKATYTGVSDIMAYYDAIMQDEGYSYSVWHSVRDIAFQYNGADQGKGKEFLYNNLMAMEQAENDNLLYIKFHPPGVKGFIDSKSKVVCMSPVRVAELTAITAVGAVTENGGNYRMFEAIESLKQLPGAISEKLNGFELRLKEMEDRDFEPEPDKVEKVIGQITGLLENPMIQGLVNGVLGHLFKLAGNATPMQPQQINGTTDNVAGEQPVNEAILNDALDRLHKVCKIDTDLSLLADMAESNPAMFQMLLSNLRNNKK